MRGFILTLLVLIGFAAAAPAGAQIPARIKQKVKQAEKKLTGLADDAVRCALGDQECAEKAEKEGKNVVVTDADGEVITDDQGQPVTDPQEAERRAQEPGEGVWRNYDFVPGRRVLRVVSLDSQAVGRFPASELEYVSGNMQVVELDHKRWLETSGNGVVRLQLPEETGESYSVEFRARVPTANIGVDLYLSALEGPRSRYPYDFVRVDSRPGVYRSGNDVSTTRLPGIVGKPVQVKLQVDSAYAIMYVGSDRVAQVPTARFPSSRTLEFHLSGNARFPSYLSDIVVAVGLDDLYASLVNEGEVTTRGLFFDTDSDRLRPESTRVLEDLLAALGKADSLAVTIEGHTDAQGDEAYNLELSERRAAAVVAWLIEHGIAESRLTAEGRGESEPVASNDTPEGRQENRRVRIRVTNQSE